MRTLRRIALLAGVAAGAVLYVWFTAVRAVPVVRRRREARRAARERST